MSEPVNVVAIGVWSAMACVHLGTAIFRGWNAWRQRSPPSLYKRVVNREKINGWRVAIPAKIMSSMHKRCSSYCFVCPSWSMLDENGTDFSFATSKFSVLVQFEHTSPDKRRVVFICRYSLLDPKYHAPIIQLIYDPDQWSAIPECFYLTDRTVVIALPRINTPFIRLILLDVMTLSYRMFTLESPVLQADLLMVTIGDTKTPRLIIHLTKATRQNPELEEDAAWQREFTDVSYVLPASNSDSPLKPISWQSTVIPLGDRRSFWINAVMHFPPLLLWYYDDIANMADVHCLVFSNGSWRLERLTSWLASFRATDFGAKWLNALDSFGSLSPPDGWGWCKIPPLRYAPRIPGFMIDGAVLCATNFAGIHERLVAAQSLKRLAATAFCKANPGYKFEELAEVIGFDVFDGIVEFGRTDGPVIYL